MGMAISWTACTSRLPDLSAESDAQSGQAGSDQHEQAGGSGDSSADINHQDASVSMKDGAAASDDPCGAAEAIDNHSRDTATLYVPGSDVVGCISDVGELDYYEFTAPAGQAGYGYFTGSIVPMGDQGRPQIYLFAANDNAEVRNVYTSDLAASLYFYLAAAPGQTYRIRVQDFIDDTRYAYTLRLDYHEVADRFEPNDTREQASALPLDDEIAAYFFAGHKAKDVTADEYADWYALELSEGTLSVNIADVATDVAATAQLFDASGTMVGGSSSSSDAGVNLSMTRTIDAAGPYKLLVGIRIAPYSTAGTKQPGVVPDHFTRPYELIATQH